MENVYFFPFRQYNKVCRGVSLLWYLLEGHVKLSRQILGRKFSVYSLGGHKVSLSQMVTSGSFGALKSHSYSKSFLTEKKKQPCFPGKPKRRGGVNKAGKTLPRNRDTSVTEPHLITVRKWCVFGAVFYFFWGREWLVIQVSRKTKSSEVWYAIL